MGTCTGYFGDVRATVLRQHAEIRARIRGLDPDFVPLSAGSATLSLRVSLFRLAILFESHLRYEEEELAPRIRDCDAWGALREAALHAEHLDQRTRLEHVCFLAESEAGHDSLSRGVSSLVVSLLEDMAREERELLELERILSFDVDQMTG